MAGASLRLVHAGGPRGVRGRNSDNSRLAAVTGFLPRVGLREGLAATYRWIETQVRRYQ